MSHDAEVSRAIQVLRARVRELRSKAWAGTLDDLLQTDAWIMAKAADDLESALLLKERPYDVTCYSDHAKPFKKYYVYASSPEDAIRKITHWAKIVYDITVTDAKAVASDTVL